MNKITAFAAAMAVVLMSPLALAQEAPELAIQEHDNYKAPAKELSKATDTIKTGSVGKSAKKGKSRKTAKSGGRYEQIIHRYASAYGVPKSLAKAVVHVESSYRANARGKAGEVGLMQVKPATARMMGYRGSTKGLYDPDTNVKYGMKYLAKAHKLGGGSVCGTILKYNAGHGAKRMNPISANYCRKVKRHMN